MNEFEPNTVPALRYSIENEIARLENLYSELQHEANSGHPDSLDAVNMQRKIRGKIEGLKYTIQLMNDMRL